MIRRPGPRRPSPFGQVARWALRTGTTPVRQFVDRSRSGVTFRIADAGVATDGAADLYGRVVNRLFRSGLDIASIASHPSVNDDIRAPLGRVVDQLEGAIAKLRIAALASAVSNGIPSVDAPPAVLAATDPQAGTRDEPTTPRRLLRRVTDHALFAYAMRGHDFYRARDDQLWADDSDGTLLSARTGTPFAVGVGNVFYDNETDAALYYEAERLSPRQVQGSEPLLPRASTGDEPSFSWRRNTDQVRDQQRGHDE